MFSFWRRQTQRQTGSGLAVQGGRDTFINVNGVSASEARDIALDVFRANLLEFRGVAQNTAMQRGEAITDRFIEKLQSENPEGLKQAETPDFQDALFTVQKEYGLLPVPWTPT